VNAEANALVQMVVLVILGLVSMLPLFIIITLVSSILVDKLFPPTKAERRKRIKLRVIAGGKKERKQ
jgi:hypothetical protein